MCEGIALWLQFGHFFCDLIHLRIQLSPNKWPHWSATSLWPPTLEMLSIQIVQELSSMFTTDVRFGERYVVTRVNPGRTWTNTSTIITSMKGVLPFAGGGDEMPSWSLSSTLALLADWQRAMSRFFSFVLNSASNWYCRSVRAAYQYESTSTVLVREWEFTIIAMVDVKRPLCT